MNQRNLIILLLVLAGTGLLLWLLSGSKPDFDLDGFDKHVSRLEHDYLTARKAADRDAIPAWVKAYAAHFEKLGALLKNGDDCKTTSASLLQAHRDFQAAHEAIEDFKSVAEIVKLSGMDTLPLVQKIIFVMAPAYKSIKPEVHRWAKSCPKESEALYEVFGIKHQVPSD